MKNTPNSDGQSACSGKPSRVHSQLSYPMSLRIWFLLTGVIFPTATIAFAATTGSKGSVNLLWQSGDTSVYAALLLGWPGVLPMLPLIVTSMTAMLILVFQPAMSRFLLVRFAIYAGALLAFAYVCITIASTGMVTLVAAVIVGLILAGSLYGSAKAVSHWRRFSIRHLMIATLFVAFIAALIGYADWRDDIAKFFRVAVLMLLAATPTLNFLAYVQAASQLYRMPTTSRPTVTWMAAWLSAALAWSHSWKAAVDVMLGEYARLPANNPNCYVSAAAAHGHPNFVQAKTIHNRCGTYRTSPQMRRLKFLEIALLAAAPKLHSQIRQLYDRYGPRLARRCQCNIWVADLTYFSLKPIEVLAEIVRRLGRIPNSCIDAIYRSQKRHRVSSR